MYKGLWLVDTAEASVELKEVCESVYDKIAINQWSDNINNDGSYLYTHTKEEAFDYLAQVAENEIDYWQGILIACRGT